MAIIGINIRHYVGKKDKTFEHLILNCGMSYLAGHKIYEYSRKILQKRWPRGEKLLLANGQSNAYYSYLYAKYVIRGRWKEAEKIICKAYNDPAYLYARYVIKGRWKEAEPAIAKNFKNSVKYARHILKGRFQLAEKNVQVSAWDSIWYVQYAKHVIKGRWKKVEPAIVASNYIGEYMNLLDDEGKEEFYNMVLMEALNENASRYCRNPAKDYIESLKKTGTNS